MKFSFTENGPSSAAILGAILKYEKKVDYRFVFEKRFGEFIGQSQVISYASARMAFYHLLKNLNVDKDDEVILPAATCSVLVNSVIKAGAKPIFSDISFTTLGSDLQYIRKLVTNKTKVIVAQHSFGIPCELTPILNFCKENNLFLIEDCALSLGSYIGSQHVGTLSDASIFSFDHSKPMNLGLGGMLVVKDKNLFSQIKKSNEVIPNLNSIKIVSVVFQLFAEAYLCKPNLLRFYGFYTKLRILCQKIFKLPSPFLDEDYGSTSKCLSYPYPAKIPNLIAKIGIKQIQNLPSRIFDRKAKVSLIVNKIENNFALTHSIDYNKLLPNVNFLRLIYVSSDVESDINKLKKILNKNDFWFNSPVIAREDNLEDYNYHFNSCKNAEFVSEHIINIPIPDSMKSIKKLLRLLNKL